ncbi:MAG: glycoside hydrolase family 140 protein [Anaerolineae bacterium]|nr:glycoside hydrolase family 140 protein [Anaerolineae bacterium]
MIQVNDGRTLRSADNGHYLEFDDGAPFFYLADTAWELFHRLHLEQAQTYLMNRAEKGFTVIQAVALAELDGLNTPNPYGHCALHNNDPMHPNERYFRYIDAVIGVAEKLGMFMGLLPTWGDKWKHRASGEPGIFTVDNAAYYGEFLGERYRDKPVIWILGGDQNIENSGEAEIIRSLALALKKGDGGNHLLTYHPRGPGQSSDFFHTEPWLDFNMNQSSHGARDHDNGIFAAHDYRLAPAKPTVDGEPRYECIPVGFYNSTTVNSVRFDAYDVRQAAYWSLLAGACGHTYGNNNIWQMWQPGRSPRIGADVPWMQALDHPGAFQMGYARRLFESRPYNLLAPDEDILVDALEQGGGKVRAATAEDGSFSFIYSPRGLPFTVNQGRILSPQVQASWFDPRYGTAYYLHTSDNRGYQTYVPPTSGRGSDWVLVLDDVTKGYADPGQVVLE